MPQKNATPTAEQQVTIAKAGLNPAGWTVIKDLNYRMIIRNKQTNEVKWIGK